MSGWTLVSRTRGEGGRVPSPWGEGTRPLPKEEPKAARKDSDMRVGILSPGDMGAAIGRVLGESGAEVLTCLEGRSELTRVRAAEAGIGDAGSFEALVGGTDVIMSVLVPSEATPVAEQVAAALKSTG